MYIRHAFFILAVLLASPVASGAQDHTAKHGSEELLYPTTAGEWVEALRGYQGTRSIVETSDPLERQKTHPSHYNKYILFPFNSARLPNDPEVKSKLDGLGQALSGALQDRTVIIVGYSDNKGRAQINWNMSWLRANTVRNYLMKQHNVSKNRLKIAARGATRAFGTGKKQALNRRIEIVPVN